MSFFFFNTIFNYYFCLKVGENEHAESSKLFFQHRIYSALSALGERRRKIRQVDTRLQ